MVEFQIHGHPFELGRVVAVKALNRCVPGEVPERMSSVVGALSASREEGPVAGCVIKEVEDAFLAVLPYFSILAKDEVVSEDKVAEVFRFTRHCGVSSMRIVGTRLCVTTYLAIRVERIVRHEMSEAGCLFD